MTEYEYEALYTIENLNHFVSNGWELVGEPTSSSHPDTQLPATCWTVRKPKPKPKKDPLGGLTAADLARANSGLG
ncbi:hypothetical protein [Pseudomonas corrugata]|uniref:hypothetical protein n=1 Tax=Pseudomonas corrugata TaxID=47879 RepID=UPI0006D8A568|nr:hypothetical protein [Pseudomonas corrugata]